MKNTRARDLILSILKNTNEPLSADQIFKKIIDENINLSTVYRSLIFFEEHGIVKKESTINNKSVYSYINEKKHYHLLECNICHKKIRLDYCPFDEVFDEIYDKTGFKVDDENTIIYGVCKECQNKGK